MSLTCQKHLFNLPEEAAYLNVAYQSPLLNSVEAIGVASLRKKVFPASIQGSDFFEPVEALKRSFARLIHAKEHERIAILASVSYGISTVVKNIHGRKGQNIVLVNEQFPSNVYAWQRMADEQRLELRLVSPPMNPENRGKIWNNSILDAIDDNTLAVSMGHVHWADGTRFNLKAVGEKAREKGAYFIVDGTQSIGALPFDVREIQADAVICAGYKWLLGPYSIAVGYFGERFDGGIPIEENWINRKDSHRFENLVNYQPEYQEKAGRYNVGECSNFAYVPMLDTSIRQILDWGVENIQHYCRDLQAPYLTKLRDLGCGIEDAEFRSQHLFGIRLPNEVDRIKLSAQLADEKVYVSVRGPFIRVAPHVYNEARHFQMLLRVLERALV